MPALLNEILRRLPRHTNLVQPRLLLRLVLPEVGAQPALAFVYLLHVFSLPAPPDPRLLSA
ncbi:MAG TPA: hypothetical protein VD997_09945 [Phycisphaerales bacterium]|nr:hypothetical protein [Phycisphaerales bacterium]